VLGSDHAKTIDVVNEVIVHREVKKTAVVCCLYATSILLNKERIMQGLSLLRNNRDYFIFAAQESFSNPLRMFSINTKQNTLTFLNEKYLDSNTQDLTRFYADAGQFYWATASTWTSEEQILKSTSVPLVLRKWETIDIDSPEDLEIARSLVKLRGGI
jgi:CMP-N-acetylneuraminic acid synthetase